MIENKDQIAKFVRDEPYDQEKLNQALNHIIDLVIYRHEWYGEEEELRSMCMTKLIEILNSDEFDVTERFANYLYTAARNLLTNHVHRKRIQEFNTDEGLAHTHNDVESQDHASSFENERRVDLRDAKRRAKLASGDNNDLKHRLLGVCLMSKLMHS